MIHVVGTTNTNKTNESNGVTQIAGMLDRVTAAFRAEVNGDATKWDSIFAEIEARESALEAERAARIEAREIARQEAVLATVTDEQRARIAARRAERKF